MNRMSCFFSKSLVTRNRLATLIVAIVAGWTLSACETVGIDRAAAPTATLASGEAIRASLPLDLAAADVLEIIDGDTIRVRIDGRDELVRFIGINAPESGGPYRDRECYGDEATAVMSDLVDTGGGVYLQQDQSDTDRYGRLLRYVWIDDSGGEPALVNRLLVAEGAAYARAYPPDTRYQSTLAEAEASARNQNLGLWGQCR